MLWIKGGLLIILCLVVISPVYGAIYNPVVPLLIYGNSSYIFVRYVDGDPVTLWNLRTSFIVCKSVWMLPLLTPVEPGLYSYIIRDAPGAPARCSVTVPAGALIDVWGRLFPAKDTVIVPETLP